MMNWSMDVTIALWLQSNIHKFTEIPEQSRHEGILSDCDQLCNKAAGKEILEKHKQSKQEGIK